MKLPHLACDIEPGKEKYPLLGLPKIDGYRLMHVTGKLTGRSLEEFANKFTNARFSSLAYAGLDGEGAASEPTDKLLCSKTNSALTTEAGEPDVHWYLFDLLDEETVGLSYLVRHSRLEMKVTYLNLQHVTVIPYTWIHNAAEREAFYQDCLLKGYEGAVYRDPEGMHKDGRATVNTNAYLREKPSSDKEALVLRIEEAMQNLNAKKTNALGRTERSSHKANKVGKGMVGALECRDVLTGVEFKVGPGKMTHKERIDFFLHPEKIVDHYIKYRSFDIGVKDKPRQGRYICLRAKEDMS